jgi:peptidoglycan/LPS O-acetylase OafA/YrhL
MAFKSRLTQLDAIRGLAALSVFLGHAFGMLPQPSGLLQSIQFTPLHFFYDGEAAVLLFFVLSGFVLNLKYVELSSYPQNWTSQFIIRRIFRVYPAFFAALVLSLLLRMALYPVTAMGLFSEWFSQFWRTPIPSLELLRLFTLVLPGMQPNLLDPPIWSLMIEMRISLIFPLIILFVNRKRSLLGDVVLLMGSYIACFLLCRVSFCGYLPQFTLGAVCAKYFAIICPRVRASSRSGKGFVMIVALMLYGAAAVAQRYQIVDAHLQYVVRQIVGLGAAGLILASASLRSLETLLNRGVFLFIGRTSYSFYLIHFVILLSVAPLLYQYSHSFLITWGGALLLAYAVSDLLFRLVEYPMIDYGSRVANWYTSRADSLPRGGSR